MPMKHSWEHLSPLRSSGRPAGFPEEQRLRAGFTICGGVPVGRPPPKDSVEVCSGALALPPPGLERETAVIDLKDTAAADPIAFRLY